MAIKDVMKSIKNLKREEASQRIEELVAEVQRLEPPDAELERFAAKQLFISNASYNISFKEFCSVFANLETIGFSSEFSRLNCLVILAAGCDDPECVEHALNILSKAKDLLDANRQQFGESIYNQEYKILKDHRCRLIDIIRSGDPGAS